MSASLPTHLVDLIYDAAHKSYWRHKSLRAFLRDMQVKPSLITVWEEGETKRAVLDRVFADLRGAPSGRGTLMRMAAALIEQKSFPDLRGWENSEELRKDALTAVQDLRAHLRLTEEKETAQKERVAARKEALARSEAARNASASLGALDEQLAEMTARLGTAKAGYEFQDWFYTLVAFEELIHRRPYVTDGRQIDGAVTVAGTTYLVELKFTAEQSGAPDVDSLRAKVQNMADNTMGLLISISGFSSVAIEQASGRRTTTLLLDYGHVYAVLGARLTLAELIERVTRHASQTGEAYIPAAEV